MKIIKQLNNNAAIALDGNGMEIVVLGKGIGFPSVPYELQNLSLVHKTFYDVNPEYYGVVANLPQPILIVSSDIVEVAENELDCDLNPNLPFTLADHLNFAVERVKKGIEIPVALTYDVKYLYPRESKIGLEALRLLEKQTGIRLPEGEAINVAMHLINAEAETGDMHTMMISLRVLSDIDAIIEKELNFKLDKNSFAYARFSMHLRYLISRLSQKEPDDRKMVELLPQMRREYPDVYACAKKVVDYFSDTWGWQCNDDELLYLMLHIGRVQEKTCS